MNIEIAELEQLPLILEEIRELKKMVEERGLKKAFYSADECWSLKGGCSLATFRTNRYFQPKGGAADATVGGVRVWTRESVEEWLPLGDAELEEYHKKHKTGASRRRECVLGGKER